MNININKLPRFRWWCHKIIPLIYDDSLSYYELLCKVIALLNEVIDTVNGLIDEDIEGYLKQLVDTYAREEIERLIAEIGEEELTPIIREIAEEAVNDFLGTFKDDVEGAIDDLYDRVNGIDDRIEDLPSIRKKVNNMGTTEYLFAREHYLWCDNPGDPIVNANDDPYHKCDMMFVDDSYYYYVMPSQHSQTTGVFRVAKSGYARSKLAEVSYSSIFDHGALTPNYFAFNGSGHIVLRRKTDFGVYKDYAQSPMVSSPTSGSDYIGRIAYDPVNNVYWGTGAMASGNNFTVYRIMLNNNNNTYSVIRMFNCVDKIPMGVVQNMTAYNGLIYLSLSNPNQICVVDTVEEKIVSIVNVCDRFDRIMPVGELQAVHHDGEKLYILGYCSSTVSGIQFLNSIGSCKVSNGEFINSFDLGGYYYSLYVSRDSTDIANVNNSIQGLTYDRYKNACGWTGAYAYLPFYHLWEAVECAVGMFQYTGKKVIINIADTTMYGETNIPAWAIRTVQGYKRIRNHVTNVYDETNIYARVRYLYVHRGDCYLGRIGFTGGRLSVIGDDTCGALEVVGAIVTCSDCNILRVTNTPLYDFENFIYVSLGGMLYFGDFGSYNNWNAISDWLGHMGTGTDAEGIYFANVNTGFVTFQTTNNRSNGYLNNEDIPCRHNNGGFVNVRQTTDNGGTIS